MLPTLLLMSLVVQDPGQLSVPDKVWGALRTRLAAPDPAPVPAPIPVVFWLALGADRPDLRVVIEVRGQEHDRADEGREHGQAMPADLPTPNEPISDHQKGRGHPVEGRIDGR